MNKAQQYNDELYSMTVKTEKDIALILAGLSPSKLTEAIEVMESVYSPSDGCNCDVVSIQSGSELVFIDVSPFGEQYNLVEFNIGSKLTILEGLENVK